jgi:hypothetical protein
LPLTIFAGLTALSACAPEPPPDPDDDSGEGENVDVSEQATANCPLPCDNGCGSTQELLNWLGRYCYDYSYQTCTYDPSINWLNIYNVYVIDSYTDPGGTRYHKYSIYKDESAFGGGWVWQGNTTMLNCGK